MILEFTLGGITFTKRQKLPKVSCDFAKILETDITYQLLAHNQAYRYEIKCCVGYISPNFSTYIRSNLVGYYSKPIN